MGQRTRDKFREMLLAGELEDRVVEMTVEQKASPVQVFSNMGMENMDVNLQEMFEKIGQKTAAPRQKSVKDARKHLLELETEALIVALPAGTPSTSSRAMTAVPVDPPPFEAPRLTKYTDMRDLLVLDPIHDVDESGWPARRA